MPNNIEDAYDVCRGGYSAQPSTSDIDCKSNHGSDEAPELEDGIEDPESLALVLFKWVAHHDGPLRGP